MPRFYCLLPLAPGISVQLPEHVAHHIHVVRLQIGEQIELFNGQGGSYLATISSIGKKTASAEIGQFLPQEAELPFSLSLAQALPEASKMDWIIEKAIELGATAIEPLAAQRCVVRLSAERAEKKLAHWQSIIESAAEQCGRNRLATLAPVQELGKWLAQSDAKAATSFSTRIILTPHTELSLARWSREQTAQAVTLMVGPEGGFSDGEVQEAIKHGAIPLAMGPRILRTETAGLAAIAMLSAAWGGIE